MELLWENQFLFNYTEFQSTVANYDWIFGFSISMLWGETLFELFHGILQVKNKTIKFYSHVVMELLWENLFIFFPLTSTQLC